MRDAEEDDEEEIWMEGMEGEEAGGEDIEQYL